MGLIDDTLAYARRRRDTILSGGVNCIPSPFVSFREEFPGTEQETYYLVSGTTKAGKSKFASNVFIFNNILYAYKNPEKVRLKIFYVPLEETRQKITMRFMCYLLYVGSSHAMRIDQKKFESVKEPLSEDVFETLEREPYKGILQFFEDNVVFLEATNPTGIYKNLVKYAAEHGKRVMKKTPVLDRNTGETKDGEVFDHYEPDDPGEYVEIFVDHISRITTESGLDLRQSINKLSDYFVELRNKYRYIPIVIQQQNDETTSLEAVKTGNIRPTQNGLRDSRQTGLDCNVMLGICNPYAFSLPRFMGYDITKLKDSQRFIETRLSRDGESNAVKALYFDGAVNYFQELPSPDDARYTEFMAKVYRLIENNKRKKEETDGKLLTQGVAMFLQGILNKLKH